MCVCMCIYYIIQLYNNNNIYNKCSAKSPLCVVFQFFIIFRELQTISIKWSLCIQNETIHHKVIRQRIYNWLAIHFNKSVTFLLLVLKNLKKHHKGGFG